MSAQRFVLPYQTVVDAAGVPIPGAFLYFYAAGTSTPYNTYSDATLTTPNSNPVQANSAGVFPAIFLALVNYKVVLTDSLGNEIWTADPVGGFPSQIYSVRKVTAAGAITVSASTDYVINVQKTIEAATVINFPTVAARLVYGGNPIFIKNYMSNGALYPLTPTPAGFETIELVNGPYTMDGQNQGLWFYPDGTVTPNNWEIR